jgi:phosphoglycolate phosphatase
VRTVIFDLDGTLADTSADLIAAANDCFRGMGYGDVLHPVDDAATAFRGGRAMLRLGFGRVRPGFAEAEVDAQYQRLLDAYEAGIDRETRLYPGAEEAVRALVTAGYATGICTNKPERLADILLARLGVRELFGSLVGADTLAHRKPHPAPYLAAVERAGGAVATVSAEARIVCFGHMGDGNLHYNVSQPVGADPKAFLALYRNMNKAVHDIVRDFGGSISAEHGIGQLKRDELLATAPPVGIDLMRRVKAAFDPAGIMNPGKLL